MQASQISQKLKIHLQTNNYKKSKTLCDLKCLHFKFKIILAVIRNKNESIND